MGVTLMKSNELMAGDWVICHHPTCEPKQIQVNVGLLHVLEQQDLGFQTEESPLFRIVEPIPLTTEILEKNGFMKLKANFTPNWYWYVLTQNCFLEDRLKDAFHFNGSNILKFKFVHELQHALRLCGIQKEIEL